MVFCGADVLVAHAPEQDYEPRERLNDHLTGVAELDRVIPRDPLFPRHEDRIDRDGEPLNQVARTSKTQPVRDQDLRARMEYQAISELFNGIWTV